MSIYTIGWVTSALAPVLVPTNLFSKPSAGHNRVRIFAGLSRSNDTQRSTGGDAPDIVLWDSNGTYISYDLARTWSGYRAQIGDGSFKDYNVPNENGRAAGPAEYISVIGGGDKGLCISAISVTTPEQNGLTWTGDIGYACGLPWYAQNNAINSLGHQPKCAWIDGNGNSGHKWKGLSVHLPSFTIDDNQLATNLADQWTDNMDLVCQSEARFSAYEKMVLPNEIFVFKSTLERSSDGTDDVQQVLNEANWKRAERPFDAVQECPPKVGSELSPRPCPPLFPSADRQLKKQSESKRSLAQRQEAMSDEVVISSRPGNDVFDLCGSETSLGPDYVSLAEGMFCDMSTKTLWPLCGDLLAKGCFDVEEKKMKWANRELKKRHEGDGEKAYTRVTTWE